MSRSAVVASVAGAVVIIIAICLSGTALAASGPHRATGHYVYTCVKVHDRAKNDTGPKVSATVLCLRLGWHNRGYLHNPKARATAVSSGAESPATSADRDPRYWRKSSSWRVVSSGASSGMK